MALPVRTEIHTGQLVSVIEEQNQTSAIQTKGIVARVLTKTLTHPRGIEVALGDGRHGRVQSIAAY